MSTDITITNPDILFYRDAIVNLINPDRIILFGSYAYGKPNEKSDIDLLVIKNGKEHTIADEAELTTTIYYMRKKQGIKQRCDIFLENEPYVMSFANTKNDAYADAINKGVILYAR